MYHHTVNQAIKKVHLSINETYGFLTVNVDRLLSLQPVVGKKVLLSLIRYIGGARINIHYEVFAAFYSQLLNNPRVNRCIVSTCVLYSPDGRDDLMVIGRQLPNKSEQKQTPISVGETVHWDGRWRITIKPIKGHYMGKEELLYIRHMRHSDWSVARRGVRKIRSTRLPHTHIRGGLPVVTTKDGYILVVPHFEVNDLSYGVECDIKFEPLVPLTQYNEFLAY